MNEEQPLANVMASKREEGSEEKMKRVMELVSMMNMAIGKDEERDRLLAEKEQARSDAMTRETEWRNRLDEAKRLHDAEIARMKQAHEETKERARRVIDTLEAEWKRRLEVEIEQIVAEKDRLSREAEMVREAEWKKRMDDSNRAHEAEIERLRRTHEQDMKGRSEEYKTRLLELESRHHVKHGKHEAEIKELRDQVMELASGISDMDGDLSPKVCSLVEKRARFGILRDLCCVMAARNGFKWCEECDAPVRVKY